MRPHNPYMGTPRENSTGRSEIFSFFGFLSLNHAHHGGSQDAVVNLPAPLKDLRHVARALAFGGGHHGDRLLGVGVELAVLGINDAHAAYFKRVHELAVRDKNPLAHGPFDFSGDFKRLFQGIHYGEQILRKLLHAELLRLSNVFGRTAPHVFHFGNRAHVKVEIFGGLGRGGGKLLAGKTLDPNGLRDELLHSIACKSAIKAGWQTSDEELRRLVREYRADGVIYESMKFCEFWSYEKVLASHVLQQEMGIPCCTIEKEYNLGSVGQLRTRFQAFVESLEIKKIGAEKEGKL